MPGTTLSTLGRLIHSSSKQSHELDITIIPNLHMKKPRYREVKQFQVVYLASKEWSQDSNSGPPAPQHQTTPTILQNWFHYTKFSRTRAFLNQHCAMSQSFTAYSD